MSITGILYIHVLPSCSILDSITIFTPVTSQIPSPFIDSIKELSHTPSSHTTSALIDSITEVIPLYHITLPSLRQNHRNTPALHHISPPLIDSITEATPIT